MKEVSSPPFVGLSCESRTPPDAVEVRKTYSNVLFTGVGSLLLHHAFYKLDLPLVDSDLTVFGWLVCGTVSGNL